MKYCELQLSYICQDILSAMWDFVFQEKQKKSFFSSGTVGKLIPLLDKKRAEVSSILCGSVCLSRN